MAENIVVKVTGDATGLKTVKDELVSTGKVAEGLADKFDDINNSVKNTDKSFKNLKVQIREAKNEAQIMAQKFGESSKEANAAARKVAELADELDDFNNRVKALNPEAKFNALSNILSGTLGAFQGLTGAVQLFGGESKRTQEIAMKLQGALNFAQGLNSLMGMKDAFKDLQAVLGVTNAAQQGLTAAQRAQAIASAQAAAGTATLTVAQEAEAVAAAEAAVATNTLNTSLLANPAFLIIVGVVALGAAFYALGGDADEATIKINELSEGQKALRDSTDDASAAYDAMRLAMGGIDDFTAKRNALEREYNKQIGDNDVEVQKANKSLKEQEKIFESLIKKKALSLNAGLLGSIVAPSDQEMLMLLIN